MNVDSAVGAKYFNVDVICIFCTWALCNAIARSITSVHVKLLNLIKHFASNYNLYYTRTPRAIIRVNEIKGECINYEEIVIYESNY